MATSSVSELSINRHERCMSRCDSCWKGTGADLVQAGRAALSQPHPVPATIIDQRKWEDELTKSEINKG